MDFFGTLADARVTAVGIVRVGNLSRDSLKCQSHNLVYIICAFTVTVEGALQQILFGEINIDGCFFHHE